MRSAIQLLPTPAFDHLEAMTDGHGLFEHADFRAPRVEHGYCTDDVARALSVIVRERRDPRLDRLIETYLGFLDRAVSYGGGAHNRLAPSGRWIDDATTDDCWGRTIGGLGAAVRYAQSPRIRDRAHRIFLRATLGRTVDVRAAAFAGIGAADILDARPGDPDARELLVDCLELIPTQATAGWAWPEARLRYANAALCDVLIVGGSALDLPVALGNGLGMLTALLEIETDPAGFLSVTGSEGRRPGEHGPLWDQQPIEVAAIADAGAHALRVTGDPAWAEVVPMAWAWFTGDNDAGVPLYDASTGAGHDGLTPRGRNGNCGAESTLAALSTLQRARESTSVRS